MIGPAKLRVKRYFSEQRPEGGGAEPQWLMSRLPVWQIVSSTHWQHPPDGSLTNSKYRFDALADVRQITRLLVHLQTTFFPKMDLIDRLAQEST